MSLKIWWSRYLIKILVLNAESISDHRYTEFEIIDECQEIKFKNTKKYNTTKNNWNLFNQNFVPFIEKTISELELITRNELLNTFITHFNENFTKVCEKSFTIINYNNKKYVKSYNWWAEELTRKRHGMNTARRRFQRCQNRDRESLKNNYLLIKKQYKYLINIK
jgi:hypothetical protein